MNEDKRAAATIAAYHATLGVPLRQVTLCLLIRDHQVLLAMKKRGFGTGKWSGVGGKPLPGERIEAAALRETHEEIGVVGRTLERVATLNFYFPHMPTEIDWNQQACVYLIRAWDGEPVESEEMAPRWFAVDEIPLDAMWADGRYWLPQVIRGERLTAAFMFDATQSGIEAHAISSGLTSAG
jgi:8-oxo-dGTP pyrophosphatase MutT (NUDIX family)